MPSEVRRRMTSNSSATSFGVSDEVGSSMTTTRASCASARAISTICCWLTGSEPVRAAGSTSKPMRLNSAAESARIFCQSIEPPRPVGWPSRKMFSATVNSEISAISWKTTLMPCLRLSRGERSSTSRPPHADRAGILAGRRRP